MNKQWFVLHTLTGQENKAYENLKARIKIENVEDYVGQILIPKEKVSEKKNGKTRTFVRKYFPGYVLAELALYNDEAGLDAFGKKQINENVWQFIRNTTGVIGFIGGKSPVPLKQNEIDAILNDKPSSNEVARPKIDLKIGEIVKINDGPFMGLTGSVSMVDPDRGKLKVEVSIFNRVVQVDVEYWQIEKVSDEDLLANPQI